MDQRLVRHEPYLVRQRHRPDAVVGFGAAERLDVGPLRPARAESPQGSARPAGSSGASAGESSEVLKRLMGRREQEGSAETTNTSDALPTGQERFEKAEQPEKTEPTSSGAADEVLRKLLQKREQEFNK